MQSHCNAVRGLGLGITLSGRMAETALYLPVKRHLESQGYTVKSEIKSCDVVAVRGDESPVIVELKTGMTIQLLFQAVDRLAMTDFVYVAIERPKRGVTSQALKLCRRIGIGLIVVAASGSLEVLADPVPYAPRQNAKRRNLLLREFAKREGDPNIGGSTRKPLMTAYRQDALRCVQHLSMNGASKISIVKAATGVDRASTILRDNVYGWFEKIERGIYGLTKAGAKAPTEFKL
jgi:hypothetical protein